MFFQPAILALLLASGLGLAALLVASPWVLQLVRHWDLQSGSRLQLVLERRTYLLSTLVGFVLVVQMAGPKCFRPNDQMDPAFGQALREAAAAGVQIHCVDCLVTEDSLSCRAPVPVSL